MQIEIKDQPYDPWIEISRYQEESENLSPGSFGACATFVGTMRDFNEGDDVRSMVLEHYPEMTLRQLEKLANDAIQAHGLLDALILHRVGEVFPNDPIVVVVAWSAHRKQAFDACREMMEHLKSKATFWKKETLSDAARWVSKNTKG